MTYCLWFPVPGSSTEYPSLLFKFWSPEMEEAWNMDVFYTLKLKMEHGPR